MSIFFYSSPPKDATSKCSVFQNVSSFFLKYKANVIEEKHFLEILLSLSSPYQIIQA